MTDRMSPPCPNCGQPMTDRDIGNKDEFQCRPCQIALAPLADMCLEEGAMLLFTMTDRDYKELPHFKETAQWLDKVNADYAGPRLKQPSFMNDTSGDEPGPRVPFVEISPATAHSDTPVRRSVQPLSPEIGAWKEAHSLMWLRWKEFINFQALKKRHIELPFEWRYDALFNAIGTLYGEYLTDHIDKYRELEAQLFERYKAERKD